MWRKKRFSEVPSVGGVKHHGAAATRGSKSGPPGAEFPPDPTLHVVAAAPVCPAPRQRQGQSEPRSVPSPSSRKQPPGPGDSGALRPEMVVLEEAGLRGGT